MLANSIVHGTIQYSMTAVTTTTTSIIFHTLDNQRLYLHICCSPFFPIDRLIHVLAYLDKITNSSLLADFSLVCNVSFWFLFVFCSMYFLLQPQVSHSESGDFCFFYKYLLFLYFYCYFYFVYKEFADAFDCLKSSSIALHFVIFLLFRTLFNKNILL